MKLITIRFYGKLAQITNCKEFKYEFWGRRAIIDILESLGVPKTEIFLILLNHNISSFYNYPDNGDVISVYPKFIQFYRDILKSIFKDPLISKEIKREVGRKFWQYKIKKFVADVHLGRLTKYLRLLGIDVIYNPEWNDEDLIKISEQEHRILLTRDKGILKQKKLTYGFYILNSDPVFQLLEVLEYFSLKIIPFSRCSICNSILTKKDIKGINDLKYLLPDKVKNLYHEFYYCEHCNKLYWSGSHYDNIIKLFNKYDLII